MPRRKNDPQADLETGQPEGSDEQDTTVVPTEDDPRSSETMVILPAADEPVRRGGHILTEDGWVVEDQPVPGEDIGAAETADEQEQE